MIYCEMDCRRIGRGRALPENLVEEECIMPVHDLTRVTAGTFHD